MGAVVVKKKGRGMGCLQRPGAVTLGQDSGEESPQPGFGGLRVGISAAVQVLISCRVQVCMGGAEREDTEREEERGEEREEEREERERGERGENLGLGLGFRVRVRVCVHGGSRC